MSEDDPHNLQRFLLAQSEDYKVALAELQQGRKNSHWIWYVFPQVEGLGHSSRAQEYAIRSRGEAAAYLEHEILGSRLHECCEALLQHKSAKIEDIMGFPDDLKLRSSMTLFASISEQPSVFQKILDLFYRSEMDAGTMDYLNSTQ